MLSNQFAEDITIPPGPTAQIQYFTSIQFLWDTKTTAKESATITTAASIYTFTYVYSLCQATVQGKTGM